MGPLLHFSG